MLSGKIMFSIIIICLAVCAIGFYFELHGFTFGRYVLYPSLIIGGTTTLVGSIAAMLGKVKKDF